MRYRATGIAIALGLILGGAGPRAQDMDALAPLVLEELKAKTVTCPDDLGDGWLCGQYRSGFSRLKFELEVELELKDYEARALTSWRLRDGRYERAWAVHGKKVTMKFGRNSHIVALRQDPLDEEADDEPDAGTVSADAPDND